MYAGTFLEALYIALSILLVLCKALEHPTILLSLVTIVYVHGLLPQKAPLVAEVLLQKGFLRRRINQKSCHSLNQRKSVATCALDVFE